MPYSNAYAPIRHQAQAQGSRQNVEKIVMLSHKRPDSVINVKVEFGDGEGKVPLDNIAKRAETYRPKERAIY